MRGSHVWVLLLTSALLAGCAGATPSVPANSGAGTMAKNVSQRVVTQHERSRCGEEDECAHLRLVEALTARPGITLMQGAKACGDTKIPPHMDADDGFPLGAVPMALPADAAVALDVLPMPDPCASGSGGGGGTGAAVPALTTMGLTGGGGPPPPPPGSVATDYVIFALHLDADGDDLDGQILITPVYEFENALYVQPGAQLEAKTGQYAFYLARVRHHGHHHHGHDND